MENNAPDIVKWNQDLRVLSREAAKITGIVTVEPEDNGERAKYDKSMLEYIAGINKKHRYFHKTLTDIRTCLTSSHNQCEIQRHLETMESNLTIYKRSMRVDFEKLNAEEALLSEEIGLIWQNISQDNNGISSADALAIAHAAASSSSASAPRLPDTNKDISNRALIGSIDRQIACLGKYGNWDPRDHDLFIRTWTQQGIELTAASETESPILSGSQKLQLIRKLLKIFPALNSEELEGHVDWYVQLSNLQQAKRSVVELWRQQHIHERQQQLQHIAEEVIDLEPDNDNCLTDFGEDGCRRDCAGNRDNEQLTPEEQKQLVKIRIAQWKKTKEDAKTDQEAAAAALKQEAQVKEAEQAAKRLLHTKQRIEQWREREVSTQHKLRETETLIKRPSSVDPAELQRRRVQALEHARTRHDKVVQHSQQQHARESRVRALEQQLCPAVCATVTRDAQRVLGVTRASESQRLSRDALDQASHRRGSAGAHSQVVAGAGRDLMTVRRAVPAWCRPPPPPH